jgi:peptide/nickel transport system permease protein
MTRRGSADAGALRLAVRAAVTLLGITLATFALLRLLPGDPALVELGGGGAPVAADAYESMLRRWGFQEPLPVQYLRWLGGVLRGDFGSSLRDGRPVAERIAERLGPTLLLNAAALGIVFGAGVPLGVAMARARGSRFDRGSRWALFLLFALPTFWIAGLLQIGFAVRLGWLPMHGLRSPGLEQAGSAARALDLARHLALPAVCLAYGQIAFLARFTRASLLESLGAEFVRAARARGLPESTVVLRHAFRNALLPMLTLTGLSVPALVGGSVVIESIFAWPGLGRLFHDAVFDLDYPLVLALTVLAAALTLGGNLAADLLYRIADPRTAERSP